MRLNSILVEDSADLYSHLIILRQAIAEAAQEIYDVWEQLDGIDDEYGAGGICDAIADAISGILVTNGITCTLGGQEGDDHAFIVAYDEQFAYVVDIPHHLYEHGGGMMWRKIDDVHFSVADVAIFQCDRPDWIDDEF